MKLANGNNLRCVVLYTKNKKHFTKPSFCVIMIKEIGFVCFAVFRKPGMAIRVPPWTLLYAGVISTANTGDMGKRQETADESFRNGAKAGRYSRLKYEYSWVVCLNKGPFCMGIVIEYGG